MPVTNPEKKKENYLYHQNQRMLRIYGFGDEFPTLDNCDIAVLLAMNMHARWNGTNMHPAADPTLIGMTKWGRSKVFASLAKLRNLGLLVFVSHGFNNSVVYKFGPMLSEKSIREWQKNRQDACESTPEPSTVRTTTDDKPSTVRTTTANSTLCQSTTRTEPSTVRTEPSTVRTEPSTVRTVTDLRTNTPTDVKELIKVPMVPFGDPLRVSRSPRAASHDSGACCQGSVDEEEQEPVYDIRLDPDMTAAGTQRLIHTTSVDIPESEEDLTAFFKTVWQG